ncbi:MAG TPA: hypothetical protein VF761_00650 [Gemmatimonadaceae bacterium]
MDRNEENLPPREAEPVRVARPEIDGHEREGLEVPEEKRERREPDAEPPHTTDHGITSPKFGSAGSGGAEHEGNLPKN